MRRRKRKEEKSRFRVFWGWILFILILLLLLILGVYLVGHRTVATGSGMRPTLEEGDVLLVDKVSDLFTDPGRFDVVVFPSRYEEDSLYVRRIIAKPGETVQIVNGKIYINGNLLKENGSFGDVEKAGLAAEPMTLGEDEYFVLSDNRSDGSDSREPSIGFIRRDELEGRARLVMWPLAHIRML